MSSFNTCNDGTRLLIKYQLLREGKGKELIVTSTLFPSVSLGGNRSRFAVGSGVALRNMACGRHLDVEVIFFFSLSLLKSLFIKIYMYYKHMWEEVCIFILK